MGRPLVDQQRASVVLYQYSSVCTTKRADSSMFSIAATPRERRRTDKETAMQIMIGSKTKRRKKARL